jgi:acyl carrier protein
MINIPGKFVTPRRRKDTQQLKIEIIFYDKLTFFHLISMMGATFHSFEQDQKSLTILPQISLFAQIFKSLNRKNMSEIATKVKQIIIEKLGVEESEVTPEASFTNDLGADSLDTVELIMEFEKEFNISIPDDQAENISTVGQAISYLEQNVKK